MAISILNIVTYEKKVAIVKKMKHRPVCEPSPKLSRLNSPSANRYWLIAMFENQKLNVSSTTSSDSDLFMLSMTRGIPNIIKLMKMSSKNAAMSLIVYMMSSM